MRKGNDRILVRHWYEGTPGLFGEVARGLLALDGSPWHRAQDALAIRVSTMVVGATRGALDEARGRLDRFEGFLADDLALLREKTRRIAVP